MKDKTKIQTSLPCKTIKVLTYKPGATLPPNLIWPQQTHSPTILEIKTGQEDLSRCDGLWTSHPEFLLGVKTADCAAVCVWSDTKFGIVHAGWRGVINGAVENLLSVFKFELSSNSSQKEKQNPPQIKVWVGPLLPRFEIQKDECYAQLEAKFGDQFFTIKNNTIEFEFKKCLQYLLPEQALFDERSNYEDFQLASWRRDKAFPKGQNTTVIGFSNFF